MTRPCCVCGSTRSAKIARARTATEPPRPELCRKADACNARRAPDGTREDRETMTSIKYTLTHTSTGREIATGRTEKQAASLAVANNPSRMKGAINIIGTDGVLYEVAGRKSLRPNGGFCGAAYRLRAAEQNARYVAAMDMARARAR